MKRILSLALALCLLIGTCAALAEAAPTVVTVAMWHTATIDKQWINSNELKLLKEKYNIELKYRYYDKDQFSLMMAGGSLDDIVTCDNNYVTTVIDNGMALDLDTVADKLPNLQLDMYKASNEISRQFMGGKNEQLFFLAPGVGPENLNASDTSTWGYGVRWDLYKEIGAPAINNNDDFIEAMKQMVALMPTNANGDKTYGFGLYDQFDRWYLFASLLMEAGPLNPWVFGGSMYMSSWEDTTLYNGYTNPEKSAYWTAMKFFNKAYNEGLLDPDSFIMTRDEALAKYGAERYVAGIPGAATGQLYTEMKKQDPNTLAGIAYVFSPATAIFANKMALTGNMPADNIFVNAKSKNLDAALQVVDFFHDPDVTRMTYSGVEGVDWEYGEDGVPVLTEKALSDVTTYNAWTDDYAKNTGITGLVTEWTPFQGTGLHPDGYPYDLKRQMQYRPMTLSPMLKDYSDFYGVTCPSELQMQRVNEGTMSLINDYGQMVATGISEIPTDIKRILDNCSGIAYRAVPELVMAKDEAEFAAVQERVLQELAAADEATAWTWCETAFNEVKAEMKPIFEEARDAFLETQTK